MKKTKKKAKTTTKRTAGVKPPPKTLFAAVDPQGTLRFSSEYSHMIDTFVSVAPGYYRVLQYDLRAPGPKTSTKDPATARSLRSAARKREKRK